MPATTLSAGDIAIIGYDTEDSASQDSLSFVLLQSIASGTQIHFTDRAWNGTAFASASSGEGTLTYTASADLPAGTVVTFSAAQLSAAGIGLADTGETIYAYQGTADAPTAFLHAVDVADGNTTFNGSLVNTGLVAGITAAAIGADNAVFGTRGDAIQHATLLAQIGNAADWAQSASSPQPDPFTGGALFDTVPDQQLWVANAGGGDAITVMSLDASVSSASVAYRILHAFQEDASLYHPSDITLDTVNDRFFFVDADLAGHNRIVQGSISQVLANPGAALSLTVLYSNTGSGAAGSIRTLSLDAANGILYFDIGTTFNKIVVNTANQTPTQLADLGTSNYVTQATIDYSNGQVLLASSRVSSFFGQDIVDRNAIYTASGLTSASTSLSFTQLPFSPDDDDAAAPNDADIPAMSGESWPAELGTIRGVDVDPVSRTLYIVTGTVVLDASAAQDGSELITYYGGVYRYALTGNASGTVTTLFRQDGSSGPLGLLYYIEVDPTTGKYYVADTTGANGVADDGGIWVGSTSTPGTPTLFGTVGNVNGMAPQGLEIQTAPEIDAATALAPTITETAGQPSPAPSAVQAASSFSLSDVDSASGSANLVGAQVRVAGNFQSGATHQDLLTINGGTSGTLASGIAYSYDSASGVLTLSGVNTFANYAAALALVRFSVTGDDPTAYGAATTRTLSYSAFDGALYSEEFDSQVSVVGVNDAPINAVGGTSSGDEDTTFAVTGLSVADVDADPALHTLTVTLAVTRGTLTVATSVSGGLTAGDVAGNGTATVTLTGTQNEINATLAHATGLQFTGGSNANGTATLTITTNDGGASGLDAGLTGTSASEQDSDTKTIAINAVNDAPTVTGDGTESTPAIFEDQPSATGHTAWSLLASQYGDAADDQSAFPGGSSADAGVGIAVVVNGSSAGTGQWQYHDGSGWVDIGAASISSAVLVAATTPIRFDPAADFNGTAPTLTVHLVDASGGAITSGATADLTTRGGSTRYSSGSIEIGQTVNAVNDAPAATGIDGDSVQFIEGSSLVLLDAGTNASLADTDSADFDGGRLTVSIGSGKVAAEDELAIDTSGTVTIAANAVRVGGVQIGTFTGGGAGGGDLVVTFDADATPARVESLLRALAYANSEVQTPTAGSRAISITLTDGDGTANGGTDTLVLATTVAVVPVSDAPEGMAATLAATEDATYVFTTADFALSDPNDAPADTLQEVVFTTIPSGGTLLLAPEDGGAASAVTAGQAIGAAQIAAGLLMYNPDADGHGTGYASFTFQVRDSGSTANGGVTLDATPETATIDVAAVNDEPVLDLDASAGGADFSTAFTEGGSPVPVADADALIADVDDTHIDLAGFMLSNPKAGDALTVLGTLPAGIVASAYDSTTGVLTLSGSATKADYADALALVGFTNGSDDPDTSTRFVQVLVSDGTAAGLAATAFITVAAVNDAGTLDLDADDSTAAGANYAGQYTPGGSAVAIADADSLIADVDDTAMQGMTVTIANLKTGDELGLSGFTGVPRTGGFVDYALPGGATATWSGNDGTLTVTGSASLADYQALLEAVRFSNSNASPDLTARMITVSLSDGSDATNTATATIAVTQPPSTPADADGAADSVTEGASAGTAVGLTASSTDPEGGAIAYSLSDDAGGRFTIDAATGVVKVGATAVDHESSGGSYTITVVATDPQGGASTASFTIAVANVAPSSATDSNAAADSVAENASNGAAVGITAAATDVSGGTVTYSLVDDAGGRFTIDSATGAITVADASLLNHESATSHGVTVRASDPAGLYSDTTFSIAVSNVAPGDWADADSAADAVTEGAANGTAVGVTASAADAHGGTVTYSLTNDAGGRFAIDSASGVVTVADASLLDHETSSSHTITVRASDPAGLYSEASVTIAVGNAAPGASADANLAADGIAESASNGAAVGITASASDVNGGTISYSLADDAGGRFAIDSATGVVTVADASLLDYEAATSHDITVRASDAAGLHSDTTFTIAVANVAPATASDADTAADEVTEGALAGASVGLTASASDPHGGAVTYSLADDAGGRFAIDASTGVVTVADAASINHEGASSHTITVRASDPSGLWSDTSFTIAVVNAAPGSASDTDSASNTIAENVATGAAVGIDAAATDVNGGTIAYSLADDAGGRFAIDSATGVVTVADASLIDYETSTSHSITVRASDSAGLYSDTDFTIVVSNVAPGGASDADTAPDTIAEDAGNGALVGITAAAADVHGGTVTYSLIDDAGGRFAIDSATGVVSVADASLLDHESATSHSVTVRASDAAGLYSDTAFSIAIANVAPGALSDADGTSNGVTEGAASGTVVGITASAADVNGGTIVYSLSDDAGGRFAIDSVTGVITVADASLLDYEAATSHTVTVRASDPAGLYSEASVAIAVANAAPGAAADADLAADTVAESAANGAAVGITASATDVNGGTISYALADDAGGRFAIDSATGIVTVADASLLDYESASSHAITVRASDPAGLYSDTSYTIAVANVAPGSPADADAATNTVSEGASAGTAVGVNASATDTHGGTVSYSLADDAGGRFAIDAATGIVTVAGSASLDYETAVSHTITVRASDPAGLYAETSFQIAVTDTNDVAPTFVGSATRSVVEHTAFVMAIETTDPDTLGTDPATVSITGGADAALFDIVGGQLVFASAPDRESAADADGNNVYEVELTAFDGVQGTARTFSVTVTDVNDKRPVITTAVYQTVAEGTRLVTGLTARDLDVASGDAPVFSLSGGEDEALFRVENGHLVFAAAPDFESPLDADEDNVYEVRVRASDGVNDSERTIVVTVSDVPGAADPIDLGLRLVGGEGNDRLEGSIHADTFVGLGGNDTLLANGGNDTMDGGSGLDTAVIPAARQDAEIDTSAAGSMWIDTGADRLLVSEVERLRFDDGGLAFDLSADESAGMTVRLLGAVFGPEHASNESFVAIGMSLFDTGWTLQQVAELALQSGVYRDLAGSFGNGDFVDHVFANLFGAPPDAATHDMFVAVIEAGIHTQVSLASLAALLPVNEANVGLTGLQETGVAYQLI